MVKQTLFPMMKQNALSLSLYCLLTVCLLPAGGSALAAGGSALVTGGSALAAGGSALAAGGSALPAGGSALVTGNSPHVTGEVTSPGLDRCDETNHSEETIHSNEIIRSREIIRSDETIRIGLMVPEDPGRDPLSREAVHAVEMAVERVNTGGGIDGRRVKVITRSGDGPWGVGSKRSVELIYDEEVHAILGSLDGENAHLVEMVIARAHIIYMETRATDPTLSGANIPWFFRVLPSDSRQADRLIEEIYGNRNPERIAVISTDFYDDRMAARTFLREVLSRDYSGPLTLVYDPANVDFSETAAALKTANSEAIVYFGRPHHLNDLLRELESAQTDIPVFTSLSVLQSGASEWQDDFNGKVVFVCPEPWADIGEISFRTAFRETYGYEPGITAFYAFDGINVLLESIKSGGTGTDNIRDNLFRRSGFDGITGRVEFQENGDIKDNTLLCR